jgi:NADH:ubiquinone oxidoreductase subunit F (NADH-binding)
MTAVLDPRRKARTQRGAGPDRPAGTGRLIPAGTDDLTKHLRRNGPLPWRGGPGLLLATVERAGLAGRGGAAFPTWRKLAAVAAGPRPVVVANGAEGEPASAKDRTLLARAPHLVLDGLQLAAESIGAEQAFAYVAHSRVVAVRAALEQRRRAGIDRIEVRVVAAPEAFVSGEESAVVNRICGGPAVPMDTPRRVVEVGVGGRPTLVQNAETLAHLALLARHGSDWFRSVGTPDQPGTFLATISGAVAAPGVYELAYGTSLASALDLAGGTEVLQAALVGGYHGGWLPLPELAGLPISREAMRPYGASPGAGVLVALPVTRCGLVETAGIVGYLAGQSARQCGPCLNGLPALADTVHRLARHGREPGLPAAIERLNRLVEGRGACHHPDGTVRLVRSMLRTFEAEVSEHLAGRCTAAAPAVSTAPSPTPIGGHR